MGIHAACVAVACVATPLLMGSNIWPIAAVFWGVMAVPVALVTGAVVGWLLRRRTPAAALGVVLATGIGLGVAAGIIISQNR